MSRLRLVTRLARRELRSRPWRTVLVALFVAVPVAGMVIGSVVIRTDPEDDGIHGRGNADLVVWDRQVGERIVRFDATSKLPGSRAAHLSNGYARIRTDEERTNGNVFAGDVSAPVLDGVFHVLSGRLPDSADEAAMSPSLRDALGVEVGDTVELVRPQLTVRIVGSVVESGAYNSKTLVVTEHQADALTIPFFSGMTFVDLPAEIHVRDAVSVATAEGYGSLERGEELRGPSGKQVAVNWTYVGGSLVLLVAGIVISAAFAVGARRQLHTLGMLAGNGAEPSVLRGVLLVEGALAGMAGVVLGFALAAVALTIAAPHRNRVLDSVVDGWVLRPVDLVPIAALGIVAAVLAALQPARSASRVSVLQALGGQRPPGRVPTWLAPLGATTFLGGLGLLLLAVVGGDGDDGSNTTLFTLTAILGGVAVVMGTTACTPVVIARLEPLASRLRGTWRLSARSLARQRSRSSGVVAAIAAAGALAIGGSAVLLATSADGGSIRRLPRDVVSVRPPERFSPTGAFRPGVVTEATVSDVEAIIGRATRVDVDPASVGIDVAVDGWFFGGTAAVGTPELARFLSDDGEAERALDRGDVVVIVGGDTRVEQPTVRVNAFDAAGPGSSVTVGVTSVRGRDETTYELPDVLIPRSVLAEIGVEPEPRRVLLRADHDLTSAERDSLRALDEDIADEHMTPEVYAHSGGIGWDDPPDRLVLAIHAALVGLALVFTLVVVAVGLGLAAAEGRAERDVLVAVGAPPRSLARLAGTKAAVLALVGGALAVPTALLPVWVWVRASSGDEPFVMPWPVTALLVIGVPAVAGVLTTASSALATRFRPVRASGFAAD